MSTLNIIQSLRNMYNLQKKCRLKMLYIVFSYWEVIFFLCDFRLRLQKQLAMVLCYTLYMHTSLAVIEKIGAKAVINSAKRNWCRSRWRRSLQDGIRGALYDRVSCREKIEMERKVQLNVWKQHQLRGKHCRKILDLPDFKNKKHKTEEEVHFVFFMG